MQRSEQAKCSCRTDGPLPEFLPQEAGRTLCSLGKLMLKSMHIHGYFFEEIYPASTVEEIKAEEAQGHSHNRVQSFSMNIRQAAAAKESVCWLHADPDLTEAKQVIFHAFVTRENIQPLKIQHSHCHGLIVSGKEKTVYKVSCTRKYPKAYKIS